MNGKCGRCGHIGPLVVARWSQKDTYGQGSYPAFSLVCENTQDCWDRQVEWAERCVAQEVRA